MRFRTYPKFTGKSKASITAQTGRNPKKLFTVKGRKGNQYL
jgi:hypothetical protein